MRVSRLMSAIFAFYSLAFGPRLQAQRPAPIPDGKVISGTLSFDGRATAGDFVGATTSVSGHLQGGADITAVKGWVEAPVQTLKTGNGKRDKDLNKSLESGKYPGIRFDLAGVTPKGGTPDSVAATLRGTFTIHGVTRKVEVPGIIEFRGHEARVRAKFPLNLKDYRIGGLSKMLGVLKMHEDIKVHVDLLFHLGPEVDAARSSLKQWPGSVPASGPAVRSKGPSPSARTTTSARSELVRDETPQRFDRLRREPPAGWRSTARS